MLPPPPLPLQVQKLSTMVGEEKRDLSKDDINIEGKRSTDHINQLMRQASGLQKVRVFVMCVCAYLYSCFII